MKKKISAKHWMPDNLKQDILDRVEWVDGIPYWTENINPKARKGDSAGSFGKYRYIRYKNYRIAAHQLRFWMDHGYIPKLTDHIDGNRDNNSSDNLRAITNANNVRSKPAKHWYPTGKMYYSTIAIEGIKYKSCKFDTSDEAVSWYYSMADYLGVGEYAW